ncbi:MAG: hypothetical protein IJV65_05005 [Kiritimatiellae bacterium]|nr:hypothetical protein [Kiritimatiellia bacterium]
MPPRPSRSGQAYLETLLVLLALLLVLFGFLQVALSRGDAEIVHHAAARAARAKAVGFNDWMAVKAARVAAIPSSGRLLAEETGYDPDEDGARADFELARIPDYLAAETAARARYVLDYEEWERGWPRVRTEGSVFGGGVLHAEVRFEAPLRMPLAGWFFPWAARGDDGLRRLAVERAAPAGEHSALYLR